MTIKICFLPRFINSTLNNNACQYSNFNGGDQTKNPMVLEPTVMKFKVSLKLQNLNIKCFSPQVILYDNILTGMDAYFQVIESTSSSEKLQTCRKYFLKPKTLWTPEIAKEMWDSFLKLIKPGELIGEDSFGSVSLCSIGESRRKFVMKAVKKFRNIYDVKSEVEVLEIGVDCAYIVRMIYGGYDQSQGYAYILEHIAGGNLYDHQLKGSAISLAAIKVIVLQLAKALIHLHEHNITHGDIKLENIGLTTSGNVKMFDFGKSRNISDARQLPRGTRYYNSPEIIKELKIKESGGWWAFEATVADVIQKEPVFFDENDAEIDRKILNENPKSIIPDSSAKDFVKQLLKKKIESRLQTPLKHDFMQNVSKTPIFIPGAFIPPASAASAKTKKSEKAPKMSKKCDEAIRKENLFRLPSKIAMESLK